MACPSNPDRARQRQRQVIGALALGLALALAGCGMVGGPVTKHTSAPTPTWRPAAGAPGVSTAGTPGWSSYHDPRYGFVAEFPSDATMSASGQGATSVTSWRFANPQASADRATLEVTETTQASAGICSHYTSGKPVALAGGVTGYEQDDLSGSTAQPQLAVVVVHDGLLSIITLTGQAPANTFMQRWGADWSRILSAFQPGQGPAGAHPCG